MLKTTVSKLHLEWHQNRFIKLCDVSSLEVTTHNVYVLRSRHSRILHAFSASFGCRKRGEDSRRDRVAFVTIVLGIPAQS